MDVLKYIMLASSSAVVVSGCSTLGLEKYKPETYRQALAQAEISFQLVARRTLEYYESGVINDEQFQNAYLILEQMYNVLEKTNEFERSGDRSGFERQFILYSELLKSVVSILDKASAEKELNSGTEI